MRDIDDPEFQRGEDAACCRTGGRPRGRKSLRGWLIENQQFDFADKRLGDLDHLLIGEREVLDTGASCNRDAEPVQSLFRPLDTG